MISIKRIELGDFQNVQAIEFYEGTHQDEIIKFLRDFKIGRNFQEPTNKGIEWDKEQEVLTINKEAFMRS